MKSFGSLLKWSFLLLFLVSLLRVLFIQEEGGLSPLPADPSQDKTVEGQAKMVEKDYSRDRAVVLSQIDLDISWGRGGFDAVVIADFKIKNKNQFDIKDLVLECVAYGQSGTALGSNKKTIFQVFPAGKVTAVKDFNMGFVSSQADTYGCSAIGYSE